MDDFLEEEMQDTIAEFEAAERLNSKSTPVAKAQAKTSVFSRFMTARHIKSELKRILSQNKPIEPGELQTLFKTKEACQIAISFKVGEHFSRPVCFAEAFMIAHPTQGKELIDSPLLAALPIEQKRSTLYQCFETKQTQCIQPLIIAGVEVTDIIYDVHRILFERVQHTSLECAATLGNPTVTKRICQYAEESFKQGNPKVAEHLLSAASIADKMVKKTQLPDFIQSANIIAQTTTNIKAFAQMLADKEVEQSLKRMQESSNIKVLLDAGRSTTLEFDDFDHAHSEQKRDFYNVENLDTPPMPPVNPPKAEAGDELQELRDMNAALIKQLHRTQVQYHGSLEQIKALEHTVKELRSMNKISSLEQQALDLATRASTSLSKAAQTERPTKIEPLNIGDYRNTKQSQLIPGPKPVIPGPNPFIPGPKPTIPGPNPFIPGPTVSTPTPSTGRKNNP